MKIFIFPTIIFMLFSFCLPSFALDNKPVLYVVEKEWNHRHPVFLIIASQSEYPYPNKKDMLNQMMGRRAAIVYAYKDMEKFIKEFFPSIKGIINDEGFISKARVVNTKFSENIVDVEIEVPFNLSKEEYTQIRNNLNNPFEVKSIKRIKERNYSIKQLQVISYKDWQKWIKNPDERYVDLRKIKGN